MRRTSQRSRCATTGRRFLPHHKSAQWRDTLGSGHGCPASGSARVWVYTNTDNARPVQLWARGCGTAVPEDMPGIHGCRWPCGTSRGGHGKWMRTPLGRGVHHQRRDVNVSVHWPRAQTECSPISEGGWTQPPPPCQEHALSAAGRRMAWQSRDRGDITPNPQRFWLRRGRLPRPKQAPETEPRTARTA